tara:strand:+ start:175 stop:840 length:666 start_codon:yes stop_codon:yes gene_type:complete
MLKKLLSFIRSTFLQDLREQRLSEYFSEIIIRNKPSDNLNILDYGSGFHPKVIINVSKLLNKQGIKLEINCFDFYTDENLNNLNKSFDNIKFLNLEDFDKTKNYDFVFISDVLHHIGIDKKIEIKNLLDQLSNKSKFILIKDHFEYSIFSRMILIFMDFIGNYKDDVSIPKRYFKKDEFDILINEINLVKHDSIENLKLYSKLYYPFNKPKYQFLNLYSKC